MVSHARPQRRRPAAAGRGSRGFTYLLVLFLVAAMGVLLAVVGESWHARVEREAAVQAAWEDRQWARARLRYFNAAPGSVQEWPRSTDDLLEDRRFLGIKRHLREDYRRRWEAGQAGSR